jgi:hypothetical protein
VWSLVTSDTTTSSVIVVTFLFSKQARCEGEFGKGRCILCTIAYCHRKRVENVTYSMTSFKKSMCRIK